MEVILEVVIEFIFLYLLQYPGALVRYLATGCRRPFKIILNDFPHGNSVIGGLVFVLIVVLIIALNQYIL